MNIEIISAASKKTAIKISRKEKCMLRKLSTLALAALFSLSPMIASSQSMSDSTNVNKSLYNSSTSMKTGKKIAHHKHRKTHKKTTAKKALFRKSLTKRSSGTSTSPS